MLLDEPGCGINRAKSGEQRKVGCSARALAPGAAAGGCAFDGAKIALQPIADAAHLVHGPIACDGNSWDSRHTLSSGPQLFRVGMTTDMSELDIIHGGEKKLFHAIKEIIERYRPAVFVYVTCVPALIGDDVEAVCSAAAKRFATPVISVVAPGFAGSKNLGNKLAGQALLDHVIGTREPEISTPCDINLIQPDLVLALSSLVTELGGAVLIAISTTDAPALVRVPSDKIIVGDLETLNRRSVWLSMRIRGGVNAMRRLRLIDTTRAGAAPKAAEGGHMKVAFATQDLRTSGRAFRRGAQPRDLRRDGHGPSLCRGCALRRQKQRGRNARRRP